VDYETQRRLICALGRRMWEKGWVAANDGNLSRRLGEGLFLVTPAGVSKGFLSPEMLLWWTGGDGGSGRTRLPSLLRDAPPSGVLPPPQ
jgi:ribulose-5-phosphate 4-epimerase/fuculose-1-phosphate aldolase